MASAGCRSKRCSLSHGPAGTSGDDSRGSSGRSLPPATKQPHQNPTIPLDPSARFAPPLFLSRPPPSRTDLAHRVTASQQLAKETFLLIVFSAHPFLLPVPFSTLYSLGNSICVALFCCVRGQSNESRRRGLENGQRRRKTRENDVLMGFLPFANVVFVVLDNVDCRWSEERRAKCSEGEALSKGDASMSTISDRLRTASCLCPPVRVCVQFLNFSCVFSLTSSVKRSSCLDRLAHGQPVLLAASKSQGPT